MAQDRIIRRLWLWRQIVISAFVLLLSSSTVWAQNQLRPKNNSGKASNQLPSPSPGAKTVKTTASSKGTLNASQLYLRAREFFAAGRYPEAIQYAAASQRRSPGSKAQTILMAQSYYRLGNVARAAKLFLSINPNELPQEASVDYVLTMFAAGRHREVIKGYGLVPDQHPYKDITRFYAGVSLMNLRLYQKAQMFLRASRRLPANLKSQRRRLLSEIDDILDNERQGVFDQSRAYSYQSQQIYFPPPPVVPVEPSRPVLPGGTPGAPTVAKVPETAMAKESFTPYAKPSLSYNQTSTKRDYHGYTQDQSDDIRPGASLVLGVKYLGRPRSFGAQPSLDLSATPSYTDISRRGSSSSLQADVSDPTNVRNVTTKTEVSGYSLSQTFGISGLYPVSDPVDLVAGFEKRDDKTKGSIGKASETTSTTSLKLVAEMSLFKMDASYIAAASQDKLDAENNENITTTKLNVTRNGEHTTTSGGLTLVSFAKPKLNGSVKSSQSLDISWLRNFDDFSLGVSANKSDKSRDSGAVSLSNKLFLSQTSAKIEGTYNMSFGVSVVASGALYQYGAFVVRNNGRVADGPEEIKGHGTGNQLKLSLKVSPVAFMSLSTSYDYTDRKLSVAETAFEKTMMQDHWSQQTTTTLNLSANYSF